MDGSERVVALLLLQCYALSHFILTSMLNAIVLLL